MAVFTAGGQEWRVRLTLGLVGTLRTDAGFEVGPAVDAGNFAETLLFDPIKMGKVLWVLCRTEAEQRGMTVAAFFDLLGGEELEAAGAAVMEAVIDFFHPTRAAEAKKRLPGLMAKVNEKAGQVMAAEMDAILSGLGGSSPDSLGSTPAT